jgi:2'-5' RNA ligase
VPSPEDIKRLVVEDGEPEDQLHLTILYLGDAINFTEDMRDYMVDCFAKAASYIAPLSAEGFALAVFNPAVDGAEDFMQRDTCRVLLLSGNSLPPVKKMLCDEFHGRRDAFVTIPDQHDPWIPHITLDYDDSADLTADTSRVGKVHFDRVRLAFGGEIYDFPLGEALDEELEPDEDVDLTQDEDEVYTLSFAFASGLAHPGNAQQLHDYWTKNPKGLAKWAEKSKPWTALYHHLLKYIKDEREAKATAAKWFHDVFHFWPGADLNRVTHGKPPRGKLVGPG